MNHLHLRRPATWLALAAGCGLLMLIFFAGTGSAAPPAGDEEFSVIADASNGFLNSSPLIYSQGSDLMALLDDNHDGVIDAADNPANDPLVIDVRSATDYANMGHIPGAINLQPYKDIDKPANLATIRSELAKHSNKTIVLACYTGHTDKLSEMGLGSLAAAGYFGTPAPTIEALKWGNLNWNTASEAPAGHVPSYTLSYAVESTPNVAGAPQPYPTVANTPSNEPAEITRVADDASLASMASAGPFLYPGAAAGQINPSNASTWTIIDVRSPADYAVAHLPGAINIPYQQIFSKDGGGDYSNLLSVDRSKPIVVYSNGQQEANAVAVGMNALGIRNAATVTKSLRFGLAYWNLNYGDKFTENNTYPTASGSAPGGLYGSYVSSCSVARPGLVVGAPAPFWASYADYQSRVLSINWGLTDSGSIAYDVKLTGSSDTNGVTLTSTLPVTVSNIISSAGGVSSVMLNYNVPIETGSWHTSLLGSATDLCGGTLTYP